MNVLIRISFLTALLVASSSCGSRDTYEYRYVCTNFSTPWAYIISINDGMIWWRVRKKDIYNINYKIPDGSICEKERRTILTK